MHIGAERVRHDAGIERLARQPIGEVAAVPDVDLEPAVERSANHLVDLALAIDEAARMARERVCEDVAGTQFGNHAFEDRVGVFAVRPALRKAPKLPKWT